MTLPDHTRAKLAALRNELADESKVPLVVATRRAVERYASLGGSGVLENAISRALRNGKTRVIADDPVQLAASLPGGLEAKLIRIKSPFGGPRGDGARKGWNVVSIRPDYKNKEARRREDDGADQRVDEDPRRPPGTGVTR
jgi:hypothetical protein